MENIIEIIRPLCFHVEPVGSRVTCNPPPTDTDADYLCHVRPCHMHRFESEMYSNGFKLGGSLDASGDQFGYGFTSYTLGEINLIATEDYDFANRFLAASSVAKRLNLLDKYDRIALFQAVLYGNHCGPKGTEHSSVVVEHYGDEF